MSSSLRVDKHQFYVGTTVTSTEQSAAADVGGARGYSVQIELTDNGSAAGTISLQASVDNSTFVDIVGTATTMAFTSSAMSIIYDVQFPGYGYVRVNTTVTAGDLDITAKITIVEGGY